MKTAGKFALIVVGLCAVAGAAVLGFYYWKHVPKNAGRNLEFRLVAVSSPAAVSTPAASPGAASMPAAAGAADISQPSTPPLDPDAFSSDDAGKFIASGDAPPGWKWLPVSAAVADSMRAAGAAGQPTQSIVRTSGQSTYLLVADSLDMTLTHGAGTPTWGVKDVALDSSDGFGPAVRVTLDSAGGNLMRQFTKKYLGHSLAVVIGGQVCMNATIQDPLGNKFQVQFSNGRMHEAEQLRDSLLQ